VVLGNLGEQDLREIWAGRARRTLRDGLAEAPAGCVGCVVADRCRGGCRGLLATGAVEIDLGARDPSCPGPWSAAVGEGAPP
jgi:radical SAM protein with 4Fe4S-binding SPASM domain